VTYSLVDNAFDKDYLNFFPFPATADQTSITLRKGMSYFKNEIRCLVPLDNTIYSFDGKSMNAKYYIDFGNLSINKSDLKRGLDYIDAVIRNKTKAGRIDDLIETDQFIIFSYYFGSNRQFGIYSKINKKAAVFTDILRKNGLPNISPMSCIGNKLICVIEGDELESLDSHKYKIFDDIHLKKSNNPIVMIIDVSLK